MIKMLKAYNLFRDISSDLKSMRERERVDLSIVPKLGSLAKEFSNMEKFWACEGIPTDTAFPAFHVARNSKLIVEKMVERFENYSKSENPEVISDAERIIPLLFSVFGKLKNVRESLPTIKFDVSRRLFEVARDLRNVAYSVGMLPSLNDELTNVDRQALMKEFKDLCARWTLDIIEM